MLYNKYNVKEAEHSMLSLSFCMPGILGERYEKTISSLPFGNREISRVLSIKNEHSRILSFSALVALSYILSDASLDYTVLRTESRKPYFQNLPLHFSLTHTDNLAAAVLSDEPVGIDFEWLDTSRNALGISKRFFSPDEQKQILLSGDPLLTFFSLWTKKEALAKLTGEGLISVCSSSPLSDYHFTQYTVELENKRGILSVCQGRKEDISILNPYKELKLYELSN